jgi:hypothetical protein
MGCHCFELLAVFFGMGIDSLQEGHLFSVLQELAHADVVLVVAERQWVSAHSELLESENGFKLNSSIIITILFVFMGTEAVVKADTCHVHRGTLALVCQRL